MSAFYLFYLTHLNLEIQQIVARIANHLNEQNQQMAKTRLNIVKRYPTRPHVIRPINRHAQMNFQIKVHELKLYQYNFEMKLFSATQFDRTFLLGTFLVIANYIIFMYQTI